jgi:hypothetical protein
MRKELVMGAVALLGGLIVACAMVSIALQHNPQGEFLDEQSGKLQIGNALWIFIPWVVVVAMGILILERLAMGAWRLFKLRRTTTG